MSKSVSVDQVEVGAYFIHPSATTVLRRVQPKFKVPFLIDNQVFATDREANLYVFDGGSKVVVTSQVPLFTQPCEDTYLIHATFERQLSDDIDTLEENYKSGLIKANPNSDMALAVQQQLALEMGEAYDNGLAGFFQCHAVSFNRSFDRDKMGWIEKPEESTASN